MIFAVITHIEQIQAGTKTQTRRRVKPGETLRKIYTEVGDEVCTVFDAKGRIKYQTGRTYSIQPGRGKKGIGRIRITDIREVRGDYISEEDALAEGDYTPEEYTRLLADLYDGIPLRMFALTFEYVP